MTNRSETDHVKSAEHRKDESSAGRAPGAKQTGIADTDKVARTGSVHEPLGNAPPDGDSNDVA